MMDDEAGLVRCRECSRDVSTQAFMCPHCGAPRPARARWDGWGIEYKSAVRVFGMPLVHVSFKYRPNFMPVPARGVIAIGQFAAGFVSISQFGVGVINAGQFAIGGWVLAQFAVGYSIVAQIGAYWNEGYGQILVGLKDLIAG